MAVMINYKICSNMHMCNVLDVCPTGAVYWDKDKKRLEIDNTKCISCGACARVCPIAAIRVIKTQAQRDKYQAEIDADPRREEDMLVDRYACGAIQTPTLQPDQVDKFVAENKGIVCIELNPDYPDMPCNILSIPISEIMDLDKVVYRAVADGKTIAKKYGVSAVPTLVFFKDGRQIGKVEGFFENSDAEKTVLIRKVKKILGTI